MFCKFQFKKAKPLHLTSRRHFKRFLHNINKEKLNANPSTTVSTEFLPSNPASDEIVFPNFNYNVNIPLSCSNNPCNNNIENQSFENNNTFEDSSTFHEKLCNLIMKYHISHNCVNELLQILKSEGLNVPKDVRTLLNTPKSKSHNIVSIANGSYIHIGVECMVKPVLQMYFDNLKHLDTILLSVNVDGLSLTHSSKSSVWPILISFINIPVLTKIVLPVGIFHGKSSKPGSVFTFFKAFITEIKSLFSYGMDINGKKFLFSIGQIICDAPAKAFLLNVKNFNAYHSCNSCIEEGTYSNRRVCFVGIDAPLRTNESFRLKKDEHYHKGPSPFEELSIDITSVVVLEYMHNVCQGVMKRLLQFWKSGQKPVRFLNTYVEHQISNELVNLHPHLPSEFNRLTRSIDELEFWKATEYRTFLLYTGPILLKGRIKSSLYQHFLLLHSAIKILISNETYLSLNDVANDLLRQFVKDYPDLYGEEYVTYNVHGLIHITNFVKIHGPLDKFSAFKFENYLQIIKKTVHSAKLPLQDMYNRIMEQSNYYSDLHIKYPILKKEIPYDHYTLKDITITLYENVILKKFKVSSTKKRDKYFFLSNCDSIVSVEKIIRYSSGKVLLEVTKYENISPLFVSPLSSDIIGNYIVNTDIPNLKCFIELSDLKYKCLFFHTAQNQAVAINLLHTD